MHCFISYRRKDTEGYAGWLADILRRGTSAQPSVTVFLDVDDIAPGENFVRDMVLAVKESDVVLLLVGLRWQSSATQSANDPVRLELEAAIQHRVPVHLVLLDGATRPATSQLPASLRALSNVTTYTMREGSFDSDVAQLMRDLQRQITPKARTSRPQTSQLSVVHANPGFWTTSGTIPIRLDGKVLGEFALSGGQLRFDIAPGRHRIQAGRGPFKSAELEFEVTPGAAVKLVIHTSALSPTTCAIESA